MKRFLCTTVLLAVMVALFLPPAWAGSGHHHGHHYRSHISIGFGFYGGPYYGGYYGRYYGGYYAPYSWGYGGYYEPTPAWRLARYRDGTGAVEVDIRPKKALVTLDGTPVGQARDFNGPWDLLVLRKGTHTVEFSAPGYMTLRVVLKVKPGGYYHFTERLLEGEGFDPRSSEPVGLVQEEPAPRAEITMEEAPESGQPAASLQSGLLHIRVQPSDATVYLDGEFLARGDELSRLHGSIPVARGEHTLEVLRPGYQAQTLTVLVEGDQPTRVRVELQPDD